MTYRFSSCGVALALALFAVPQAAFAQSAAPTSVVPAAPPPSGNITAPRYSSSDGVLRYPFPGPEPTVTCRPLYVCDVALQPGESILNIGAGDTTRWIIQAAQSGPNGSTPHVFIKPTDPDLRTNLIVTTTKHVYFVRLISAGAVVNPRIGFYYPDEEAQAAFDRQHEAERLQAEAASDLPLVPPAAADHNYSISGEQALFPATVYNDGLHTYLQYVTLPTDLPIVVGIALDGTNQIVNYRLKDTTFIVDGTPSGIDLILNAGTGKHGRGERRVFIRHK